MTTPGSPPEPRPAAPRGVALRNLIGPVLGLVVVVIVGRLAGNNWPALEARIGSWGAWGYAAFSAAWVTLSAFCFPVSVMGISSGALFGFPVGLGLVVGSGYLAALLMYVLGKGLLRHRIRAFVATRPKLAAIDRLAGAKALRLNALTRLSPLNYGLACYTLAAGRTGLRDYLLGNLATVPSMVLHVWLGTLAVRTGRQAAAGEDTTRNLVILAVGLTVMGVLGWQITRLVREALAEHAAGADAEDSSD